ncbi:MAG TPA: hypothetical protein VF131_10115 [Blastocatellia bacterium]|nr:hypothetical protein [Blastocatellia bacterium]
MAEFCFFTDADKSGLLDSQASSTAFGAVSDTEFRVTSLHTAASNPRVFAICDGKLAVQQGSQSNVISLILQPKDQPGVGNRINFVSIKYIIYKGVLRDSLISGSSVADRSKNQLTRRAHETQDIMNRAIELASGAPANSLTFTPSSALLGYNISGTDSESLDKLFYKPDNSLFEPLSVAAGDHIGDFDKNKFGIEIVLDDVRANANFILTKHVETKLQAPVPTASNPSQLFKRRHQKEAAISFMDPCAFFGSFFQYGGVFDRPVKLRYRLSTDIIDVEKETKDSDLHKANGTEIYDDILVHFFNKNAVYIDMRNELNTSINFYQHYDNNIKLKIPEADDEIISKDYYGNNGWPLLVLRPQDYDLHGQNNNSTKDTIKIEIALPNPSRENASPLVYISQGYKNKIKRNKVLRGEKRYVRLTTSDHYTESFSVVVPNIASESVITPVSQYIRIKYLKSVLEGASSGIVPRASNYLDLLFQPVRMKIQFAVTANSKSRIYQEDVFLSLSAESGCESAGAVGIAQDTKNFTLFAYAGHKLRTTGTTRLQTITLPSEVATESHFLNLVRDRYPGEKLLQGTLKIGSEPNPTYLRFADGDPTAAKNLQWPNLSDEFVALIINKFKFAEMVLDHSFSGDYDVFVRLRNEESKSSDGIVYTTYDLVLEGYTDDGTSIFLDIFDPGIKVYSFGQDHNLILVDGAAEFDASTPQDEHLACSDAFSDKELGYLQSFINGIQVAPQRFRDIYTKVFKINNDAANEISVTGDGTPGNEYKLINPFTDPSLTKPSVELPKGFLAEGCTIFILHKFQQQLVDDIAAAQDSVDIDSPTKSDIYKALKDILIAFGFIPPATDADRHAFNQMMNPDTSIGERKPVAFLAGSIFPTKKVMYRLMERGNLAGSASDRKFIFPLAPPITEPNILAAIAQILTKFSTTIAQLVDRESACAYRILSGYTKTPKNLILATGNGTSTNALFRIPNRPPVLNRGVFLFNYEYDATAGVLAKAERAFPSFGEDVSTTLHITTFGFNNTANSTVVIKKDEDELKFVGNVNNPILQPLDSLTAKVRYDATGKYFYKVTPSGPLPLAFYDPIKRDLIFIETGGRFSFKVEQTSGSVDEITSAINVVDGEKIRRFYFEAQNLFLDDVFDLTPSQKDSLIDPVYDGAVRYMIDRLINVPNIPIIINLGGNFVGEFIGPNDRTTGSKVRPNTLYQFVKDRSTRTLETPNDDPVGYPPLRYSFGSVVISQFNIIITIDSFVSPRRSRLDLKVPSGKRSQLDHLTNYFTIDGSDAYLDPPSNFHPPDPDHPNLPSYNPILSGLRSFGLAEALKDILIKTATDSLLYDAFDVGVMKNYLEDRLTQATVLKNERLGIGAEIMFSDYTDFKP